MSYLNTKFLSFITVNININFIASNENKFIPQSLNEIELIQINFTRISRHL